MDTFLYFPILSSCFMNGLGVPYTAFPDAKLGPAEILTHMAEPGGEDQHSPWPQWKRPVLGAEICWHPAKIGSTSGFDQEKCGTITNRSCSTRVSRQTCSEAFRSIHEKSKRSIKIQDNTLPRSFVPDVHAFVPSLSKIPSISPSTMLSSGRSTHGPLPSSCCRDTMPKSKASRTSRAQLVALLVTLLCLVSHSDPHTTWNIEWSSQVWWKWRYMLTSCDTTKQPYLVVDLFLSTLFLSTSTPWGAILGTHHDPGVTECQNLWTNFLSILGQCWGFTHLNWNINPQKWYTYHHGHVF